MTWSSANADTCVIEPDIGSVAVNGSMPVSPIETTTYTITATGPEGSATDSTTVTVTIDPLPSVAISADPDSILVGEASTLTWSSVNADSCVIEPGIGSVDINGSTSVAPTQTTTYTITATGPGGSATDQAVVTVTGGEPKPDDPFAGQYWDLIPSDATADYDTNRFSIITGRVQDLDSSSIADVSITIHGHLEYGTASTDAEGQFSIPVNGGGTITLVYQKQGLITAHRKVHVSWNEIAVAETIQMISQDSASTTVTFDGNPNTVITHQGTEVTDEFGTRSSTTVFTGDNLAYEVDADGNVIGQLTTITTRATEFTTPKSMPAILPANSGYTYCAELSVDGVQKVKFDKPVITWVDNFLGFDVGDVVPVGYYDRDQGEWVPSDNGVVVKLLDTDTNGIVDALDADGDDQADDLNDNGSFSDEVTGLDDPIKYPPGATFWRVAVIHFTPWDCNWPYGPPSDAIDPNPEAVGQQEPYPPCETGTGSFVEDRSRIFHEDIPIPGTDMTLHYASNRVEGYKTVISIPASGSSVPSSLQNIIVEMNVAGRTFTQVLDPLPDQITEFSWDGFDFLGEKVFGSTVAAIKYGFVYPAYYMEPGDFQQAFAQMTGGTITAIRARQEITLWNTSSIEINSPYHDVAQGWTLSSHHFSQPNDSIIYKGDGTILKNSMDIIERVAGTGESGSSGDGGPALEAELGTYMEFTIDASGNVYLTDGTKNSIRKIDSDGIITTIAGGNKKEAYSGDGGPAVRAKLNSPDDIESDADGNLYFIDGGNCVVRKIDTQGIITTVAGNGTCGYSGDGGPAIDATLEDPDGIALDSAGNIYTIDSIIDNHQISYRIRKIDSGGIINTIYETFAGSIPSFYYFGSDLVVDIQGNIYFFDWPNSRVRKIDQDGTTIIVAGNGGYHHDFIGDGGPATSAPIGEIIDLTLDSSGNLYIAVGNFNMAGPGGMIKKVDRYGIITTIAGSGIKSISGDGGLTVEAGMFLPDSISFDPLGNLFIADFNVIRKIRHGNNGVFPDDNGIGYMMAISGQHEKTIDIDTGATLRTFGYDQDNNLISITDQFGNQTTIQRDSNNIPTSIISPDGLTTQLTIDGDNHLTRITYPGGSHYDFEYTPDGLMTAKVEPEINRFEHFFDSNGKLTDATDEAGGHWQFSRTAAANGSILSEVLTGEGNLTSYLDHTDSTGEYTSTITGPSGSQTLYNKSANDLIVNKSLPCGMDLEFKYNVDSEYKFKFVKEMTESTSSFLEKITFRDKTYQDTDSDDTPDLITETVMINDKSTTLENNVLQSQKTITSHEGRTVTTLYDPVTLVSESVSIPGLFDTTYGYDTHGRLTSVDTHTRGIDLTYNAQGFLESITDPENHTTTYSYDAVGRITQVDRPDISSLWFSYDNNGNMTVLTNPSTINHGFGYNKVNLNSSYQTPISGSYSYMYDKDRRLKQINFPSGNQTNRIYDKTRLMQIQTPEGNIDFTYLCSTKVGSMTKGSESITYGYDGKLVTSETLSGALNQSISYGYNNDFNLTGLTYAGAATSYLYDNDGLLTGAGSFTITRNAGNGLPESVTGGALSLIRGFNGYGEVEGQDFTVSGQNLTAWNLIRDNNGRITQKTETVDSVISDYVYTYDPMGRLLTVTKDSTLVEAYQYDTNGTRSYEMNTLRDISGRSFTYSDEDHLLTVGPATYQYNLDGFLSTKTEGTNVTTYDYSSRGELLVVTLPEGRIIEYVHDPLGRIIAKKIDGVIVEKYLWQGLTRLLAVYDGSDNLLQRFEYADGRMPVAMTSGGSTYYLTYDPVGSLRVVADASGNVVKRIDYDSFGNIIDDTNPAFNLPFGFAGGLHDRDTGLVRFGYRDYDPDVGRWSAKDPILFAGGDTDLYGYVLNDPVSLVDPWGLFLDPAFSPNPNQEYGHMWMSEYGNQGPAELKEALESMGKIAEDVAVQACQATIEQAGKKIHPAIGITIKIINLILGAKPAHAPTSHTNY
ncbi:MAG: RHS repeat-associated core domain-containing protein [Desulfobacterales bacterium]